MQGNKRVISMSCFYTGFPFSIFERFDILIFTLRCSTILAAEK
jgi:hypothetical protein